MQIFSNNQNNNLFKGANKTLSFKGKVPSFADSLSVAKRAGCKHSSLNNLYDNLLSTAQKKSPDVVDCVDGVYIAKNEKFSKSLIEAGRDFLELPLDLLDDISSYFPNSKFHNLGILQKHREHILEENKVKAFQGFFEYGSDFLQTKKINPNGLPPSLGADCSKECQDVCNKLQDEFNEQMNKSAEFNIAAYDTKKERFNTRMISGLTGALFLGNDFYNSAILKGKNEEEAEKVKRKKQGQEIKENLIEGFAQYGVMACFAKLANTSLWFSVASGVGVSTLARILSRKMSGMRLTRMEAPENSMAEFVKAAKNNEPYKTQSERDEEAKNPMLSLKNILLGCAGIIAAGFALKKAGSITGISSKIKAFKEKSYNNNIEQIFAKPDEIKNIANIAEKYGEPDLISEKLIEKIIKTGFSEEILIGEKYRTTKLPGGLTFTKRALKKTLLTPLSIIKETVTYPYKLASNFVNSFKKSRMEKSIDNAENKVNKLSDIMKTADDLQDKTYIFDEFKKALNKLNELRNQAELAKKEKMTGSEKLTDTYHIKNIYNRYKKFEEKYGSDPAKLEEEFGKYLNKLRASSLNKKTSSKIKNAEIAVMAQVIGTLTGMWFNMNDEYNAAIRNGDNKQEAEKAARKRGLNKFARMTSQVAISGALNKLFRMQYQGSLIGAGFVVALSTIITDTVSRVLTAMPTKKMNKEELEQYQYNHKNGKMAWYYNLIDKLAS